VGEEAIARAGLQCLREKELLESMANLGYYVCKDNYVNKNLAVNKRMSRGL
jgi:hypothetical protein